MLDQTLDDTALRNYLNRAGGNFKRACEIMYEEHDAVKHQTTDAKLARMEWLHNNTEQ